MNFSKRSSGIIFSVALATLSAAGCATVKHPEQGAAGSQAVAAQSVQEPPPSMKGTVVETMDVAAYTYLNLEDNGRRTWYAVPLTKAAVGQQLAVKPAYEMDNFKSRELNRTFDKIYFSDGLVVPRDAASEEALKVAHAASPAAQSGADSKVERATGANAFTVAELYEKRSQLDKQGVEVRAKVVKVAKGVMGKNWLHLRDGSGDAASRTNDLVATTNDEANVGDVVTLKGTLYKDKDFGSGYKYSMIIEQGTVTR